MLRTDVHIKLTLSQMLKANLIITAVLAALVFLVIFCYKPLMNQFLWLSIACLAWFFCTGGLVYIRINAPDKYLSHLDPTTN